MIMDKKTLRRKIMDLRKSMDKTFKSECDEKIFACLINLPQYRNSDTVLCYVSTETEVDTRRFIDHALNDGKKVAVPRCFDNGKMIFFEIKSLNGLERSSFGIDEPCEKIHRPVTDDEIKGALCIVPALSFDRNGMRLGYGGGYYDRFLSRYTLNTVGICYSSCMAEKISVQAHDIKIENIITENEYIGG